MPVGWRIAINNLSARRFRTILIVIAVALATSMVVAVTSAIQSATASTRAMVLDALGETDLRVRHQLQGRFPSDILGQVSLWDEVEDLAPRLTTNLPVTNLSAVERTLSADPERERREVRDEFKGVFAVHGVDFDVEWAVHPSSMLSGRPAQTESECVIDPRIAKRIGAEIGDRLLVGSFGLEHEVVVVGVMERETLVILQKPEMRMARSALREIAGYGDVLTSIDIRLRDEFNPRAILEAYRTEIEPPNELVLSDRLLAGLDRQLRGSYLAQYLAVVCIFLCAAFIVLTGMTTAVTERVRELAVLRCLGATRGQIFRSQVYVGAIVGLIGGLVGLPLGVFMAIGMFVIIGDLIREGLQFGAVSLVTPLMTAVAAGVAGAMVPAFTASRISPLTALGIAARSARARNIAGVTIAGAMLVFISLVSMRWPQSEQVAFWLGVSIGLFAMVLGFFLLSVILVAVLNALCARWLSILFRIPPGMLSGSVQATPYRHGFTAGALMLGLAAMVSLWSTGEALVKDWITPIEFPDAFVVNMTGIPEERVHALANEEFIENICTISTFRVPVADGPLFGVEAIAPRNVFLVVFEPAPFFEMTNLEWVQGDEETATSRMIEGGSILVAREFLAARGIGVGDTLRLGPENNAHEFAIVGVVSSPGLDIATSMYGIQGEFHEQAVHCVFISRDDAIAYFGNDMIQMVQFDLADGISNEEAKDRIREVIGAGQFGSGREMKQYLLESAEALLVVSSTFAVLGMIIAGFGMANVIAANVSARRFEYGVLRAVGASRGVLIRLVLAEGVIIALAASVVGTAMGLYDALNTAYFQEKLIGLVIRPRVPLWPIASGWLFLIAIAIIAALPPILILANQRIALMMAGARE